MAGQVLPIILGANINAYAVAASFHANYHIKPVIVAGGFLPFTQYSIIMKEIISDEEIYDNRHFLARLAAVKNKYKGHTLLLIGTTDEYVQLIIRNKVHLEKDFLFNYPEEDLFEQLYYKHNFYQICEQFGLDIPATFTIDAADYQEPFKEDIQFPVILKADDGTAYFDIHFEGKQKIYHLNSYQEVDQTIRQIKHAGYEADLIIQEYVAGPDQNMWDIVYYGDTSGKGQLVTLAQVLLQEPQLTAVGNYTSLITRFNSELMNKVVHMMETLHYTGFANFDLKYDARDDKFKFFEVNTRVGRSSSYIKESGYSIARCYMDDLVNKQQHELVYLKEEHLFSVIPNRLLLSQLDAGALKEETKKLIAKRDVFNPLKYRLDTHCRRKGYLMLRDLNYYVKFNQNEWKNAAKDK
ncbi:carboxylate--amine ligase [Macrococcus carouselicus]|uniref:Carboxylate--amine ligase n=1 Tax=Macrococcus carouselicus TaxID=69969 RepID=A0A9Q8CKU0_9STAP|nr:carboxylate--amine ligase [Macrococcus carouselicus]TDM04016.1 carboxylate--amine ligase [Macrococcus carouselicus]